MELLAKGKKSSDICLIEEKLYSAATCNTVAVLFFVKSPYSSKKLWGDEMVEKRRKDQWTSKDDEKLAEIVIQFVQNGKTQLEAFEHAAKELQRTKQACGFRWNKTLRTQYSHILENVKKRPKQVMRSHLKLALTNFEELSEAYSELKLKYRDLKHEHEKMIKWVQQGQNYIEKKKEIDAR